MSVVLKETGINLGIPKADFWIWWQIGKSQFTLLLATKLGFPGSSAGKESAWNAGDPGLIPGLGRPSGEGIGYPLQYSWDSLVAQLVKNPTALAHMFWQNIPGAYVFPL